MAKKVIPLLICFIIFSVIFPDCVQPQSQIVITGSVLERGTDKSVGFAPVVFQLDSIRYRPVKTDQFGFFLFRCAFADTTKMLKYYVQSKTFLPQKGALKLRTINDPLVVWLDKTSQTQPTPKIQVSGRVVDLGNNAPLSQAHIEIRIGDIILPDTVTDAAGKFSFEMVPDDLGKVATYRVKKSGYAPRYGYFTIQKQNSPILIKLAKIKLTVSGYIKNFHSNEPIDRVKIILLLNRSEPVIKYTNEWGYFTHNFQQSTLNDTLRFRAEKTDFHPLEGKVVPEKNDKLQLDLKMKPTALEPIYKNKYFLIGSTGIAVLIAYVIISNNKDDDQKLDDLPLPPVPPGK